MLHLAVNSLYPSETRADVVSVMINMGVDVNAVDEEGNLSTHGYIGECKNINFVILLLWVLFVLLL